MFQRSFTKKQLSIGQSLKHSSIPSVIYQPHIHLTVYKCSASHSKHVTKSIPAVLYSPHTHFTLTEYNPSKGSTSHSKHVTKSHSSIPAVIYSPHILSQYNPSMAQCHTASILPSRTHQYLQLHIHPIFSHSITQVPLKVTQQASY